MPAWAAWHSGSFEIGTLVTDRAAHCRQSKAVLAARDRRLMQTLDVALAIAGGMAVHAARMGEDFGGFGKQGCRARCGVRLRQSFPALLTLSAAGPRRHAWPSAPPAEQ